MKIGIHVDGPVIRGNEHQVIRIAAGLAGRGHEVVVSCRAGGAVDAALRAHGIRTTGVRPRGDADVVSALRFAWWLRRERFDAVLLTSWVRAFIGGWAVAVARVPRVVFRLGGIQPVHAPRARLERLALRRWYDAAVVNSELVRSHLTAALPEIAPRVHVVVNGIEAAEPVPAVALRDSLGVPAEAVLAVAVGGLEPNKGYDVLIDAVAAQPAVHVVLVGGGQPHWRAQLEARAQATGVAGRLHFLGRRTDVPAVLAACDVFVLPSRVEGFSVARLEAMRAGLPVIASAVGGTQEALAPHAGRAQAAGWAVPVGDAAALAAALDEVVADLRGGGSETDARRREAAWRLANWFSTDAMISGYEAVLTGDPSPAGTAS